jgi:hypothetical protein
LFHSAKGIQPQKYGFSMTFQNVSFFFIHIYGGIPRRKGLAGDSRQGQSQPSPV